MLQLHQYTGFCAVCTPVDVSAKHIGDMEYSFGTETSGNWTLDFDLDSPLVQNINRFDSVVKLSDTLSCQ